jgi:hypothetical protein
VSELAWGMSAAKGRRRRMCEWAFMNE